MMRGYIISLMTSRAHVILFVRYSILSISDFHGAWDDLTGTNAPLYYQGYGNENFNIHQCVENYVALGVPREKISKLLLS